MDSDRTIRDSKTRIVSVFKTDKHQSINQKINQKPCYSSQFRVLLKTNWFLIKIRPVLSKTMKTRPVWLVFKSRRTIQLAFLIRFIFLSDLQ
jgi:hypothetical protein